MKINTLQEAKQAAFNGAVKGLSFQEWKVCQYSGSDGCLWNTGQPGFHCAVGWLIPWESQKDRQAGTASAAFIDRLFSPPLQEWVDKAHKEWNTLTFYEAGGSDSTKFSNFVESLQAAHDFDVTKSKVNHDKNPTPKKMRASFRRLAKEHKLKWPASVA